MSFGRTRSASRLRPAPGLSSAIGNRAFSEFLSRGLGVVPPFGNQAFAALVSGWSSDRKKTNDEDETHIDADRRRVSRQTVRPAAPPAALGTLLHGQHAPPAQTVKPASFHFELGPFNSEISTHRQLAALARLTRAQLQDDLIDLPEAARAAVAEKVGEWTAWIDFYLPYLEKQGDAPLNQTEVDEALTRFKEFTELQRAIAQEKRRPVIESLRQAKHDAEAAAHEAEKLKPRSDDALRTAYRSGEESAIKEALHMAGTALDLGVAMHELSREISESIAHYMEIELHEVSHLTEWLTKVNKGLVAINLAFALTEEERATELEEGMRQVGVATEAFAAGAAILGAPAHVVCTRTFTSSR